MLKGFVDEFKKFIFRGNVVELAVAVVIGKAFGEIVDAIVKGLFMPVINAICGGYNVSGLKLTLYGDATLHIGIVLQEVINFLIIGFCLFLVVKTMNKVMVKKVNTTPPEPPAQEKLLAEIRDLLKEKK